MRHKPHHIAFLISVPVALLLFVLFSWSDRADAPASISGPSRQSTAAPLRIQGFSFSRHQSEKRVFRLSAGDIRIEPRKFMIFNIRPFNEAVLEDVRVEFFRYPDEEKNAGPTADAGLNGALKSLNAGNIGLVTRGVVEELEVRFHDREELVHWLRADKVRIDLRKRELRMAGVRICDQKENREILARKAVWRESEGLIHIPGTFLIETPRGRQKGKGGAFRLQPD